MKSNSTTEMRDSLTFAVGLSFISTSTRILLINTVLWVPVAVCGTTQSLAWYKYRDWWTRLSLSLSPLDAEDSIPHYGLLPIPVAVRSKAWVYGRSLTRIVGSNLRIPPGACLSLVSVVCCQVEVSATSWSLVQRSPTECGVSKQCDREASKNEAA
jgi:hypothetical protein